MYKYENIKKVLTFIPSGLKEEENEAQLLSWALMGFKTNVRNIHTTSDILFCITQLDNHVVSLPSNFKKFLDVIYMKTLPDTDVLSSDTWFLQPDINGVYTTIFQRVFYQYFQPYATHMRYVGSNTSLFDNGCIALLCDTCSINFSVSKDVKTLTTDMQDGYVGAVYEALVQDDSGNYLIPDSENLWFALAHFVEAKHWQDRAFRKEENANNMFIERMAMANRFFAAFRKEDLFAKFDPQDFVFKTQYLSKVPQLIAQSDTTNPYKGR